MQQIHQVDSAHKGEGYREHDHSRLLPIPHRHEEHQIDQQEYNGDDDLQTLLRPMLVLILSAPLITVARGKVERAIERGSRLLDKAAHIPAADVKEDNRS